MANYLSQRSPLVPRYLSTICPQLFELEDGLTWSAQELGVYWSFVDVHNPTASVAKKRTQKSYSIKINSTFKVIAGKEVAKGHIYSTVNRNIKRYAWNTSRPKAVHNADLSKATKLGTRVFSLSIHVFRK